MRLRSNAKQLIITVICSFLTVGVNYAISFFLTSYISENIGTEAYGFVSLAKTISNYIMIITVALNSFAARYISIEYHKKNIGKANEYFNTVYIAGLVMTLGIFIASMAVILHLELFLKIPDALLADVKRLFMLDTLNVLILACSTAFMAATTIKNRLELGNIIKMLSYILEAIFLLIAYRYFPPRVYYVGIGLVISAVIILILNVELSRKLIPELKLGRGSFSKQALKDLMGAGIWNSINSLGNTLNTGLDLLISNMLLSTLATGQLAIVKTISTIFSTLFQLVAMAFQPTQLRYYANGDKESLVYSFKLGIKINGAISNIAFAGFAVFGAVYYKLWTPSQDIRMLQTLSLVTILGNVIEGAVYPLYYGYNLTVKNKIPCMVTIMSGISNVAGMYVLIKYANIGIYAVVLTTTVLTWLVNFVFNPMYMSHCIGIKETTFYPILLRHCVSSATLFGIFWGVSQFFYPKSWLELIWVAIVCTAIGIPVHLLIMLEKKDIKWLRMAFTRKYSS